MTKRPIFTGAGVAIVTPFAADGSVDYELLRKLVDFQIENGTNAIIACGTTGESSTLSHEEHVEVIRVCIEQAAGRVPVIAGTGSNQTDYAIELSLEAQELGADALLLVTPYYNKTSQAGLVAHYTHVADRVKLPVIVYNVPSRTGVNVKPETYAAMADHPRICAIKEANSDIAAATKTAALVGDRMDLYVGNDDQIVPFLALGAKGVISVLSNVLPRQTSEICSRFFSGDVAGSLKLQLDYLGLANALFCDVNPIPVKEALCMMGWPVGYGRLPLVPLSEANRSLLRGELEKAGLI